MLSSLLPWGALATCRATGFWLIAWISSRAFWAGHPRAAGRRLAWGAAGGWPGRLGRLCGGLLGGGGSDSGFFAHAGLLPFYVFSYAVPHSMPLPEVVR